MYKFLRKIVRSIVKLSPTTRKFSDVIFSTVKVQSTINAALRNEAYLAILYNKNTIKGQTLNDLYKAIIRLPSYDHSLIKSLRYENFWLYLKTLAKDSLKHRWGSLLLWIILFYWIFFSFPNSISAFEENTHVSFDFKKNSTNVKFSDLIGIDEFKEELVQIVDFLKDREKYLKIGASVPRGVLLSGPPGCGKTQLARAVANEANLPFISLNCSELMNPIIGESQRRIRLLFKAARAHKQGAIIFIDEIDTLQSRNDFTGVINSIQNELLTELDGFHPSDNILVIAATNREKVLDRALTRSGRFDFKIIIRLPLYKNRIKLFEYYLAKVKRTNDVDPDALAKLTVNFSPAEIKNMVNKAAYHAVNQKKSHIDQTDLMYAFERLKLGVKSKHMDDERFRENAAFKEAAKAVLCLRNKFLPEVKKVSINAYSSEMIGKSITIEKIDATNFTKQELLARIDYFLAAKAAEELFIAPEKFSSLPRKDLEQASRIAQKFVGELGMAEELTLSTMDRKYLSDAGKYALDKFANNLLNERYKIVKSRLTELSTEILKVKAALLKNEELGREELLEIVKN